MDGPRHVRDTFRLAGYPASLQYHQRLVHRHTFVHHLRSRMSSQLVSKCPTKRVPLQKPVVSVLLLPPPARATTSVPTIRLPEGYKPTPDPWSTVKRYTGRTLDRLIGYTWWLLTMLGAGSAIFGLGNLFLSLGMWRWWSARPVGPEQEVLLP